MDSLQQLQEKMFSHNNTPVADFDNLSPTQFYYIINNPYSENSPVHFQKIIDNETLDQISLFRVAEDFIKILERDQFIKLTPLGALPKKVMVELYDKKYIYDDMIELGITKLSREIDCMAIGSTKIVLILAGIVKKIHGKLSLTKKGVSFLKPEKRQAFFELFITTFAEKFNWGYNDGYPDAPIGQRGWTFSIYLLHKYSDKFENGDFYAQKYLKALPKFVDEFEDRYSSKLEQAMRCYAVRSFSRFLEWFGLVERDKTNKRYLSLDSDIKATDILTKVFEIKLC